MINRKPPAAVRRVLTTPAVLASAGCLGLATAVLVGVAWQTWKPVVQHHAETEARAIALAQDLKELKIRQDMAALYRTRVSEVETLEKKLRLARSEPEFVAEIEKLTTASGTEMLQFSSRAAPKDKAAADTTVFEFYLKGDYAGLKAFIAGARDLPEFVTVERIVLERIEPAVRARVIMKRRTARKA